MPIYDYRCDHCGHNFSAVQSFKDEPLERCPNCGKRPRRLIVPPAIVFKGSGWYKTDSRVTPKSEGESKEAKTETKAAGEKPAATSAEKSAPKGGETGRDKPAPKPEAAS